MIGPKDDLVRLEIHVGDTPSYQVDVWVVVVDIHMPEKRPSSNLKRNSPQSDSDWGRFPL